MWLLDTGIRAAIQSAMNAGFSPTADQMNQLMAFRGGSEGGGSRILSIAGDKAEISIKGVMTDEPDFFAMFFGGGNTTYPEIRAALAEAENNPDVTATYLNINSGGGHIAGLFDVLADLELAKKPITAVAGSLCASAAYAIASKAQKITANNRASRIGSVGIAASFYNDENAIEIASTNAPKKRPDLTTEEGQSVVREELDAIHDLFVEAIAEGRGTTKDKINAEFGQGATLLADEAKKRGMIDSIRGVTLAVDNTNKTTASGGNKPETKTMDLQQLRAQHPDVYEAAVQAGVDQERDRVCAHLIMGEQSGAMQTASAAIKDGSGMTATLQATYLTAGMNRNDVNNRQADDQQASVADGVPVEANESDQGDIVADMVEKQLGIAG